jgi:hypothetical protein
MSHTAEPGRAGGLHRVQHRSYSFAQFQVGIADDGGRHPRTPVPTTCALRRQAFNEFDLPSGTHVLRAIGAVSRLDLDEHRRPDVVTTPEILGELGQEVPLIGHGLGSEFPQVMMRVTDGKLGLQGRFRG